MRVKIKTIVITCFSLSLMLGCELMYQPVYSPPVELEKEPSYQETAELNVEYYIRKLFNENAEYKMYNFGQLTKVVPKSVAKLDSLKTLSYTTGKTDSLISYHEKVIKKKNLHSYFLISHLFEIKQEGENSILYEYDFYLDSVLKVTDVSQIMNLPLSEKESQWLYHYMIQYPLFTTEDRKYNKEKSNEIYDFYNSRLILEKENKAEVLKTALLVIENVYAHGEFSPEQITQQASREWVHSKRTNFENYKPVKFSKTSEITEDEGKTLLGYKLFHNFSYESSKDSTLEKTLYFEFDPYFIIVNVMEVMEDIDDVFKN